MGFTSRHIISLFIGTAMLTGGGGAVLSQEQLDTQTKNAPVVAPSSSKSIGAPLPLSSQPAPQPATQPRPAPVAPQPQAAPIEMQRSGLAEEPVAPPSTPVSQPVSQPVVTPAPAPVEVVAQPTAAAMPPSAPIVSRDPDLAALPQLPPVPTMDDSQFPACREDHQSGADLTVQAKKANACMVKIDAFYADVMTPFQQSMIDYQIKVADIYLSQVSGDPRYTSAQKGAFYDLTTQEHAKANPDGPYMASYRLADARYKVDRAYLDERYCVYTRCPGYQAYVRAPATASPATPATQLASAPSRLAISRSDTSDVAPVEKPKKKRKVSKKDNKCDNTARKGGGLFGSILGGVVGQAAGLGAVGTALASAAGGILVSEIACKLTEDEQEKAAEVTLELTRAEEVGATASWESDTRENVSGVSTITAMNTEPSGLKCMNITDVVIIDGEEARATKRMCRQPGESRYTLAA